MVINKRLAKGYDKNALHNGVRRAGYLGVLFFSALYKEGMTRSAGTAGQQAMVPKMKVVLSHLMAQGSN